MMYLLFMQGTIYMAYNVPGIATARLPDGQVADLRACSLSTETKAHAEQRTQNYRQAPLLLAIPCYGLYFIISSSNLLINSI